MRATSKYSAKIRYAVYLHKHHVKLRDIPKGEKVIFFLRDPISRFTSGFYSRQRQGQPRRFRPWTLNEKSAFEEFSTPNQLAVAIYSTDDGKKQRAQLAMKSIRHVSASYWKWFECEEYFRSRVSDIFFIGFQDRLIEDFEILKLKLDLPKDMELPNDEVIAHKNPTELDRALTNDAIKNLKKWYKDEYKFITICKEIIHQQQTERAN